MFRVEDEEEFMPRPRKFERLQYYFAWQFGQHKNNVFYVDGRSNRVDVGRHSLGERNREAALAELRRLDLEMAVKHGLAHPSALNQPVASLSLDDGIRIYLEHVGRPAVMGGATKRTVNRYRPILAKFKAYALERHVRDWQSVTKALVQGYGAWLKSTGRAYRTQSIELITVKQAINHLSDPEIGLLPASAQFGLGLRKARGTPTYCYTEDQVRAMIEWCFAHEHLVWLARVIAMLAYTGMRISEVAQLEWPDIDMDTEFIHVRDETRGGAAEGDEASRSTKNHSDRQIPMHGEVVKLLRAMPGKRSGRVFHGPRGGVLKPDVVLVAFKRDVRQPLRARFSKTGTACSFEDGHIHSFRHFACSHWFRNNVQEDTIRRWLGHDDPGMVKLYRHLATGEHLGAMSKVRSVGGECPARLCQKDAETEASTHPVAEHDAVAASGNDAPGRTSPKATGASSSNQDEGTHPEDGSRTVSA